MVTLHSLPVATVALFSTRIDRSLVLIGSCPEFVFAPMHLLIKNRADGTVCQYFPRHGVVVSTAVAGDENDVEGVRSWPHSTGSAIKNNEISVIYLGCYAFFFKKYFF